MNYDFSEFRVVVVAGPQRSGTTIAARIIAHDSGMQYVDEDDYGTMDRAAWLNLIKTGDQIVVHSPAMSRYLISIGHHEDVAIVWMLRPLVDIARSQKRISWRDAEERARYKITSQQPIALVKLLYWRAHQSPSVQFGIELAYGDLADHPLWVTAEQRRAFLPRQWEVA